MDGVFAALEHSGFGNFVRNSTFFYPAANIIHVVAVLSFFALVAVMDLRLLRVFEGISEEALIRKLRPWAIAALTLIAATGFVLFTAEATAIAANPVFRIKLLVIVLALLNVLLNAWAMRNRSEATIRLTAGLSLVGWLLAAALGRTIAYL